MNLGSGLVLIVSWLIPLLIVFYIIRLLRRLTEAVERIEWRLAEMADPNGDHHRSTVEPASPS